MCDESIGVRCLVTSVTKVSKDEKGLFLGLMLDDDNLLVAIVKVPSDLGLLKAVHRSRVRLLDPQP